MKLSNDRSDRDAINRLKKWLASNPEIPCFRQRANKAAICRQAGIARSTADANSEIRAIVAGLDLKVLAAQRAVATYASEQTNTVPEVASPRVLRHGWPTPANRDSLALEHLLQTGRVVR